MAACPFDTLPDDLLCEVFLHCLPSNRWETTPEPSKPPTVLTLVCKRWRAVALGFPLLWCWVKLSPSTEVWKNHKAYQRTVKSFRAALARSQSAPLNLMLRTEILELEDVTINSFLIRIIQPSLASLTRLVLLAIPIGQLEGIRSDLFPSLQSLVFCMVHSGENDGERPVVAFRDAPALRRVVLDTTFLGDSDNPRFVLPWSQLTHFLDCDGYSPCTTLFTQHIIKQKPQLHWLGLDVTEEDTEQVANGAWEEPPGLDFIVMDTVTTLALSFEWEIGYLGLFDKVDFPNVRTLRLTAMEAETLGGHADRFFAKLRTFKKLEFLSIHVDSIDPDILETLLKSVPTVRTLHLFIDASYRKTLQLLEAYETILPRLHTLVLVSWVPEEQGLGSYWIPASGLQNLLEVRTSRPHPTLRIRKVVVWGDKPSDVDDERDFVQVVQKFVETGEIIFERHVGKVDERNVTMWMEMDPGSRGWEEAGEAAHFLATLYGGDSSSSEDEAMISYNTEW